ncbi:Dyp-type peroxidase [Chryseobacterium polytrichastri]|uniref:Putative iron-dependent peroxidase n=1 Tax=Chryseobacterium polytrichastri TaxID=1302687 RepID=A0A1M7G8I7_9FLAO|nr:Dyp-type peroxidase [Chryseobacterium polytrichastri]SHM12600.1 putative iron-dependent peroxidase [Chryseobacterium polytrichastri]
MGIESQNVTDYPNSNTIFMVWKLNDDPKLKDVFQQLCALVLNLNNSVFNRFPDSRASCVMGIGYEAWKKLKLPIPMPKELATFEEIKGIKHTAVSTPGDLHFHLRADNKSLIFDMAIEISNLLTPLAEGILEIHGFKYWDARSILGFVDGTENPHGDDRNYFAKIGDEDQNYKGGSYLFVQKYLHNMDAWKGLSTEEQEKVIGRSKENDIEMSDDVKPSNSHIALANVEGENGEELKIVRDNMPFGNPSTNEFGTYFIAYASTFTTTKKMLTNMFIGDPVGNYDRILDFSTAVTGTLFFVPTRDMLDDFSG